MIGDADRVETIHRGIAGRFPNATAFNQVFVPVSRAILAVRRHGFAEAIASLEVARPCELGEAYFGVPAYVRGEAYLESGRPKQAIAEFEKVSQFGGGFPPLYAVAQVGIARARAADGDIPGASKAYEDFLAAWKNADPDLPLLGDARREYAALPKH